MQQDGEEGGLFLRRTAAIEEFDLARGRRG